MNICTCHLLITRPAKHRLSFPLRLPESLITIELSTSLLLSSSSKICASTRIDFRGGERALSNISPGMHLPPPVHEQAVSPSRFCHSSTGLKMSLIKRAGSGERNTCARVSHPHSESRVGNALWRGMNTPERRERERETGWACTRALLCDTPRATPQIHPWKEEYRRGSASKSVTLEPLVQ